MIVDMHTLQRIRSGQRTAILRATRLLGERQPIQTRRPAQPDDPAVDRERQVRHPDRPAVVETHAWVQITGQEQINVQDLPGEDMQRLGYPNPREFRKDWPNDRVAWFVTFELVTRDEPKPRYLAPATGYTTSPIRAIDDAECVDEWTQQEFADRAQEKNDLARQERRREEADRRLEDRVRDLRLAHDRGEVDASRLLAGIERRVKAGESKRRAA